MGDILFLAHRIPYPPDRGDRIRSFHILRHLAKRHPVHLVGFVDSLADRRAAKEMLPMLASLHMEVRAKSQIRAGIESLFTGDPISIRAFKSRRIRSTVLQLMREQPISTIFVYSGQMAQYVPRKRGSRRFVMDFVDVDSEKFAVYGEMGHGPMAWINRREGELLADFENDVAYDADLSLFVSEAEAALFRQRADLDKDVVRAINNGIDTDYFNPAAFPRIECEDPMIVFTGQMDYRPNIDAAIRFANRTFPAIRAKHPSALFAIVGRDPASVVRDLASLKNVIVTGTVPDVRPWLAAASVVVAPLDIARGVQNKVLEAMAMARPVVASPAAFVGIDAAVGEHLLVAQGYDMANAVSHLLNNPGVAEAMGAAARQRMLARYGWDAQLSILDGLIG